MKQPTIFDALAETEAVARRTDPATSWAAASSVESIREKQKAVYRVLVRWGPMHDEALVQAMSRYPGKEYRQSVSGIRTRRSELVRLGLVVATGEHTITKAGRRSMIWRAVP